VWLLLRTPVADTSAYIAAALQGFGVSFVPVQGADDGAGSEDGVARGRKKAKRVVILQVCSAELPGDDSCEKPGDRPNGV
jgi:hypothetical protein